MKKYDLLSYPFSLLMTLVFLPVYLNGQCEAGTLSGVSAMCNVDINCFVGNDWQIEKRGVILYSFTSDGGSNCGCTGALINNTSQDGTLYFLTARHCISSQQEAASMVFYWNYEKDTCGGTIMLADVSQGAEIVASSSKIDFTLVKLNQNLQSLPACISPYFLGWDISGSLPTSTTSIHHPQGGAKKISIDNDSPETSQNSFLSDNCIGGLILPITNSFWKTKWDVGTVEKISSGAPLFNESHRIVGTFSSVENELAINPCTVSSRISYSQKLSYSWDYKSSIYEQLKHWLDPIGSGVEKLDGFDPGNTCVDTYEGNNTITSAASIFPKITQTFTGYLYSKIYETNDVDYYKVQLEKKGTFRVTLEDLPADYKLTLIINGNEVIESNIVGLDNEIIQYCNPENGLKTVYIKIEGYNGTSDDCNNYKLRVDFVDYFIDTYEPNNNTVNAQAVFPVLSNSPLQESIESYIFPNDANDYYKIEIDQPGTLTIDLTNLPEDYGLALWDSDIELLDVSFNMGLNEEKIEYTYNGQGLSTFYLLVNSQSFEFDECQPYNLSISWTPDAPCEAISLSTSATPNSAAGQNDGTAEVTATSGLSPFTYLWSNGATTPAINGLSNSTYTVTVTGADGCQATASVFVGIQGEPDPYCTLFTKLTDYEGTFSDGSGSSDYENHSFCQWLIQPPNVQNIKLSFTSLDLDSTDMLIVFDGFTGLNVLDTLTGSDLPQAIYSTESSMLVRFITDGDKTAAGWNASYTSFIPSGNNRIMGYEFWFNEDIGNKTSVVIAPTNIFNLDLNIPAQQLGVGLHSVNYRFKDVFGKYSSVISQFFEKTAESNTVQKKIIAYEYWFDDDLNTAVSQNVPASTSFEISELFDVNELAPGLHKINFRFLDNAGAWSSVASQFFEKLPFSPSAHPELITYEYWFDEDYDGKVVMDIEPGTAAIMISDLFSATGLNLGLHSFNIRFMDNSGTWSSVSSHFFEKIPTGPEHRQLTAYEYWFDSDYGNKVFTSFSPGQEYVLIGDISASALNAGLHSINFRFQDNAGGWSGVVSQFFHKIGETNVSINLIAAYRYWFDEDFDNATIVNLNTPVSPLDLMADIDASGLPTGEHVFHIQFLDLLSLWSSALTETFTKETETIVADFSVDQTVVCVGNAVQFTNSSYNALEYEWDFGDGQTSTEMNPVHTYAAPGGYQVVLTATNLGLGLSDEFSMDVTILALIDPGCNGDPCMDDIEAPIITNCPPDITSIVGAGTCNAIVAWGLPDATDNCSLASMTANYNPGDLFPEGITTVIYTATDISNNTNTCSFSITVIDNQSPVAVCDNVVVEGCEGTIVDISSAAASSTDNCSGVTITNDAPATFPLGSTLVTYTVTDNAGNQNSCIATVVVQDLTKPVIQTCPASTTVDNLSDIDDLPVIFSANDNCDQSLTLTTDGEWIPAGNPNCDEGQMINTYTVTDASGNAASCTQTITVLGLDDPGCNDPCADDTEAPVILDCPGDVVVNSDVGMCGAAVTWTAPTATDNCAVAVLSSAFDTGSIFPVGITAVGYTATDLASNSVECSFNVTVVDIFVPDIICPGPLYVDGCGGTVAGLADPTVSDNCGAVTVSNDAPPAFPLGPTTVVWTATDGSGNASSCTSEVIVADASPPELLDCPPGQAFAVPCTTVVGPADFLPAPIAADNCSVESFVENIIETLDACGAGIIVREWSATDGNGNTAVCQQTITVVTAPPCTLQVEIYSLAGACNETGTMLTQISGQSSNDLTYLWSNGASSDALYNVVPGSYSLTVTDNASGCVGTASFDLNPPFDYTINIDGSSVEIVLENYDYAFIYVYNAGYSYFQSVFATQAVNVFSNVPSGDYSILFYNYLTGCYTYDQITIEDVVDPCAGIFASILLSEQGGCNGVAQLEAEVQGGTPPFQYVWGNGNNGATLQATSPAVHAVTVTDALGCTSKTSLSVDYQSSDFEVAISASPIFCKNEANAISADVTGTYALPLDYQWNNGQGGPSIVEGPGIFEVTVSDANGCTQTALLERSIPEPLTVSIVSSPGTITCADPTVELLAQPMDGTAPYTYAWSTGLVIGGFSTGSLSTGSPGNYWVVVTDVNGCTDSSATTVLEDLSDGLEIELVPSGVACNGSGSLSSMVNTATGNDLSYQWSNSANSSTLDGLPAGTYSLTVTDNQTGCTGEASHELLGGFVATITVNGNSLEVALQDFGTASVNVHNADLSYSQTIYPANADNLFTGLPNGDYIIEIFDETTGCFSQQPVNISIPPPCRDMDVFLSVAPTVCLQENGSVEIDSIHGGTAPYSYVWSNGDVAALADSLAAGKHYVTVTDVDGCTDIDSVNIDVAAADFNMDITVNPAGCSPQGGTIFIKPQSGTAEGYTFSWEDGASGYYRTMLDAGTYVITITDNQTGCMEVEVVEIVDMGTFSYELTIDPVTATGPGLISLDLDPYGYYISLLQNSSGQYAGWYIGVTDHIEFPVAEMDVYYLMTFDGQCWALETIVLEEDVNGGGLGDRSSGETASAGTEEVEKLLVRPNPTSGAITIECPAWTSSIRIYNVRGETVALIPIREGQPIVQFDGFSASGLYLVQAVGDGKMETEKLVVKK